MYNNFDQLFLSPTVRHTPVKVCDFTGLRIVHKKQRISFFVSGSAQSNPDFDTTDEHLETDAYYFRLKVKNSGNQKAESVEVFAAELSRRLADGTFKAVTSFLPMNLVWADIHTLFYPAISPHTYKHCDLAHIINPEMRIDVPLEDNTWPNVSSEKTILSFDTFVKPYTKNNLVCPGTYRLKLTVAAANSQPVNNTLEFNVTGDWYDDEQRMLEEGVGIRLL
jgi:hypothetical protein